MILDETQDQRDQELSELVGLSVDEIRGHTIAGPDSIRIFAGGTIPNSDKAMSDLYRDYRDLDFVAHLRTLMMTSVKRRHPELTQVLRGRREKTCLDFGSGVATHGIGLAELGNKVFILDVPGRLFEFAKKRFQRRSLVFTAYNNTDSLPADEFDFVVCTNVLEHVFDPVRELDRIFKAMKTGGVLHLEVSNRVKDSGGHFKSSIIKWRQSGPEYLKSHFIKTGKTTYVRL